MLKMIGFIKNKDANAFDGTRAVKQFWSERGLSALGTFIVDGSGLSPRNAISAHWLANMMRLVYKEKDSVFAGFYESLPIAGVSGTMRGFGKGSFAENNLRAKSGSIERVRSHTGYVKTRSGHLLSFSIIANNYDCTGNQMARKLATVLTALSES
jgi:D-alanyl-D-alanine carboxypeptidase/D-alanyl-D-alanine-endopeptidase (penicillin-binding protein 4)